MRVCGQDELLHSVCGSSRLQSFVLRHSDSAGGGGGGAEEPAGEDQQVNEPKRSPERFGICRL